MGSKDIMMLVGVVAAVLLILFVIVAGWLDDGDEEDWGDYDDAQEWACLCKKS